jgi:hypothetical protein
MAEEKRTAFAMAAVDFAGSFNTYFGEQPVMGYQISLTAPVGQSTGGGVQARQHITLTNPVDGQSQVVGACNTAQRTAELRGYDYVAAQFQERFGQAFPIPQGEYASLMQKFQGFCDAQQIAWKMVEGPKASASGAPAKKSGGSVGLIIGIVVVVLVIAGGLVYWFGFHQQ